MAGQKGMKVDGPEKCVGIKKYESGRSQIAWTVKKKVKFEFAWNILHESIMYQKWVNIEALYIDYFEIFSPTAGKK